MIPLIGGTQNSQTQRQKVGRWLPGLGGAGNGELLFNGSRVSVWDDKKALKMDSGDGCITMVTYLMQVNCTLGNGQNGKFYVIYIYFLLQFFKE